MGPIRSSTPPQANLRASDGVRQTTDEHAVLEYAGLVVAPCSSSNFQPPVLLQHRERGLVDDISERRILGRRRRDRLTSRAVDTGSLIRRKLTRLCGIKAQ